MLLDQIVPIKINSSNKKHFIELGYELNKCGETIYVDVKDLMPYSSAKVKIKCDFCGSIFETRYYIYTTTKNKERTCCSNPDCQQAKREWLCENEYGVKYYGQVEEFKEKKENSCIDKYGFKSSLKNKDIRNKIKETCINKYGTEYAISSKVVRSKIKESFLNRYGVEFPTQIDSVMESIIKSKYEGGSQVSSKQQREICDILGGELNYPLKRYYLDIAFPNEKIDIEYNGSGHDLSVRLGMITQEEFDKNERFRRKQIFNSGWDIIEIISSKNIVPESEELKNIFEFCCNLFFEQNKHYIKVDLDKNIIFGGKNNIIYKTL